MVRNDHVPSRRFQGMGVIRGGIWSFLTVLSKRVWLERREYAEIPLLVRLLLTPSGNKSSPMRNGREWRAHVVEYQRAFALRCWPLQVLLIHPGALTEESQREV